MLCALTIVTRNTNSMTTIEIKSLDSETLQADIKVSNSKEKSNGKEKTNNCLIEDPELLWRSEVLKIIRGI